MINNILSRGADSRLFHTVGPEKAKLHCPVDVYTFYSSTVPIDADRNRGCPVGHFPTEFLFLYKCKDAVWFSSNIVGRINEVAHSQSSRVSNEMGDRLQVYHLGI